MSLEVHNSTFGKKKNSNTIKEENPLNIKQVKQNFIKKSLKASPSILCVGSPTLLPEQGLV